MLELRQLIIEIMQTSFIVKNELLLAWAEATFRVQTSARRAIKKNAASFFATGRLLNYAARAAPLKMSVCS
jgi:hypothetical protein